MKTRIEERLSALREEMKKNDTAAYVIPTADPHMSEYPAACWKYREWISGFTGSAGTVVVTADKAGLWTDSRYFLQAEMQLEGTGIDLFRLKMPDTPSIGEFLLDELDPHAQVGVDGETMSQTEVENLSHVLGRGRIYLRTDINLLDALWTDRPAIPDAPIFEMPVEFSGKSTEDKLTDIHLALHKAGADCTVLSALDEVAWTCNIRGTDVAYNPVAIAYLFVSNNENVLFIHPKKVPEEMARQLQKEGVILADYTKLYDYLKKLPDKTRILLDPNHTNAAIFGHLPEKVKWIEGTSPANKLKAIKNETELNGFHAAVVRDGVALTKFYYWLETSLQAGETITELDASRKLSALRSEQPYYLMDSFESISAYAAHGAIVHYAATPETNATLKPEGLYLLDSGAQYMDGTTDITRTIALGEPTEQMRKDFTRVLKGTISLAKSKFPAGTRGSQLDILARKALWDAGLNFLHGTGHGIGHCLNVHEGPQSIRMEENPTVLEPGMVTSDEPGLYRAGEYGIRTENMIVTREDSETEFGRFLHMETLTLCYIDTRLIIVSMLSAREHAWLNKYHQEVYEKLAPSLSDDEREWLRMKTREI
ncbi:peptidase M24 [Parabacteroides sp. An277]|uniref:aminopeptidase P family protein n=1 Tax=Parabacteroides sp. An277 TaxID=1965619 RepID=UPI000B36838A|nr:aminopeptidase P family protein [Parabacteroides sp. An277]OUO53045.1 peptidase M24 [Parabacteroides sp. An277]